MKLMTLTSIITFSLITTSMAQASMQDQIAATNSDVSAKIPYGNMTTAQLQVVVERHIIKGNLSFTAGKELMERWANSYVPVKISYSNMTTAQLQVAVENHSLTGNLSFTARQELMKRWSQS